MSVLTTILQRARTPLASTPRGWIGIDIGSRSIKLAQIERLGEQYYFHNRWTVTRPESLQNLDTARTSPLLGKQLGLADLRTLFSRRESAAAVSMSFQTLRSLELPAASREEMRDMVSEELAAERSAADADGVFDFWSDHETAHEAVRVTTLSMPTTLATGVANDLFGAGYECRVLDGLPCALARAVTMAGTAPGSPVVALDLGDAAFTFVLVRAGKPLYTRVLRGGGLRTLIQPLQDAMDLSHEQAMQLLIRYAATVDEHGRRALVSAPAQLLESPMMSLVQELKRTLEYISQQFRSDRPSELVLFGGGASIRHLSPYLATHVGLPAQNWRLSGSAPHTATEDAYYGIAAALSVLRWEQHTCL